VICVRESTERQEGVDAGTVELVGSDTERIVNAATVLLSDPSALARRKARRNPYGDGRASERIIDVLETIVFDAPAPAPFGPTFDRGAVLRAGGSDDPLDFVELEREDDTSAVTVAMPIIRPEGSDT
jgi:UDP-N-acetylglucosamine 2-epimerase (non-hydrolysing)